MLPDLALWLTHISSNYPYLEHIFMVPKVFEPLKFYCISIQLERTPPHWLGLTCYTLTLKAPNKNCSRLHFNFLLLSFEENKAWFFMWILCLAEDSLETSSLSFSEKQWKIFMNVVCCSCDWCFKEQGEWECFKEAPLLLFFCLPYHLSRICSSCGRPHFGIVLLFRNANEYKQEVRKIVSLCKNGWKTFIVQSSR